MSFAGPAPWRSRSEPHITSNAVLVPTAPAAIPLMLASSLVDGAEDAGLTVGWGPAVPYGLVPDCGCDACDSGSQDPVDVVDSAVVSVVGGAFRHLADRDRRIIVTADGVRSSGGLRRRGVDVVVADPTGWVETTCAAWIQPAAS